MSRLIIERFCDSLQMGVFGKAILDGEFIGYAVEQPWRDNQPFKSCIPAGDYEVVEVESQKFGRTIALKNLDLDVGAYQGEATRYACLIHPANAATQLQGCIALGRGLGYIRSAWAVTDSATLTHETVSKLLEPGSVVSIIWKDHP